MPRMSKKRKQEWALFLNDRNKAVSIFPVVFLFSGGKED